MKKIIRDLLSLDQLPCSEAAEWVSQNVFSDKIDIVVSANENWREWTAIHTRDQEILSVLATDQDWAVRSAVASNANTPAETLLTLATDQDSDVRSAVASNANTPAETLLTLATDQDSDVRSAAINNKNYKQ